MPKNLASRFEETTKRDKRDESSILENLSLVRRIAYRLSVQMPKELEVRDLIGAGMIGLVQAARDYDPSHKSSFKTYATIRIRGAILDAVREQDWVPRSVRERYKKYTHAIRELEERLGRPPEDDEIRTALDLSKKSYATFLEKARPLSFLKLEDLPLAGQPAGAEGAVDSAFPANDPRAFAEFKEARDLLSVALDSLPDKEQKVIQLYYYEELNLKEIGQVLGIGESRVCQLHTQALMRLKGNLNKEEVWK